MIVWPNFLYGSKCLCITCDNTRASKFLYGIQCPSQKVAEVHRFKGRISPYSTYYKWYSKRIISYSINYCGPRAPDKYILRRFNYIVRFKLFWHRPGPGTVNRQNMIEQSLLNHFLSINSSGLVPGPGRCQNDSNQKLYLNLSNMYFSGARGPK